MAPNAANEATTLMGVVSHLGLRMTLKSGQVLFHEGDESEAVYAVMSGRINISMTTPVGREVLLGIKVPGQVFGELSALDRLKRSATATATETTILAQLQGNVFLDEVARTPALASLVIRELSAQLRRANARIATRDTDNTTVRVGHLLLELAEKFRRHASAQGPTTLPITQDELAAWVGSTREATARCLATYRRDGLIETGRQKIIIPDVQQLSKAIAALS
jgi:CRP/FNR family transcriptional regulator, cyclic AMP receptor protein